MLRLEEAENAIKYCSQLRFRVAGRSGTALVYPNSGELDTTFGNLVPGYNAASANTLGFFPLVLTKRK